MEQQEFKSTPPRGLGRGNIARCKHDSGLRRPHCASGSASWRNLEQQSNEEKRSMLSVDAPEFVPKMVSPRVSSRLGDRLKAARGEVPTSVQSPQLATAARDTRDTPHSKYNIQDSQVKNLNSVSNDRNYEDHSGNKELETSREEASDFSIVQYLVDIIDMLTLNPADFATVVPSFVTSIKSDTENLRYLQQIVTTIVDYSISETNFRYSGARLCTYLDTSVDPDEQTLFRDVLYYTCKFEARIQELEWQRCKDSTDHLQKRCHGLILFLAELVVQMNETLAFNFGAILIQLIINVLKKPASNSVKYICQALKLAGQTIEKDKSKIKEMENMMRALTDLVTKGQVDTHVGRMVHSVRELRKGDWGRTTSNSDSCRTQTNTSVREVQQLPNEPVMYGPDGGVLSAEESKFLQDHIEIDSDQNDPGMLQAYSDDEYDDEMADAYEQFLIDEGKIKSNSKLNARK